MRKMRKKVQFLVTCCLVACLILGGCGKSEPPLEAPAPASTDASPYEPAEIVEEYESEEVYEEAAVEEESEIGAETEVEVVKTSEPHGIIVLIGTGNDPWDSSERTFTIISVDPASGEIAPLSTFVVPYYTFEADGETAHYDMNPYRSMLGNYRNLFSPNFDKLAVTLLYQSNEMHTGWINDQGNFVDVTAKITAGEQSDFSSQLRHATLGFSGSYLTYSDGAGKNLKIPESDLSLEAVTEYDTPDEYYLSGMRDAEITDWVDDTSCVINHYTMGSTLCELYNTETKKTSSFIPETTRCNWSGVLSPDGTTVAFLSMPSIVSGDAEIFTVPLAGGEPTKVNLSSSLQSMFGDIAAKKRAWSDMDTYCCLLDWIE